MLKEHIYAIPINYSNKQPVNVFSSLLTPTSKSLQSAESVIFIKIFYHLTFYFTGIFIPPSIIFNIIILCMMIKSGKGTQETTRLYYIVMAYGELGTVIFKDTFWLWLGIGWPSVLGIDLLDKLNMHRKSTDPICSLVLFMWYIHEMIANNTMVLFAVERVVALYVPLHVHSLFTFNRALQIICAIIFCAVLISFTIFKFTGYQDYEGLPIGTICHFIQGVPVWSIIGIIVFVYDLILPAVLSIICSVLIALKLTRQRLNARKNKFVGSNVNSSLRALTYPISLISLRNQPVSTNMSNEVIFEPPFRYLSRNDISVCLTILLISCLHLVFYLPVSIFRIIYLLLPAFTNLQYASQYRLEV